MLIAPLLSKGFAWQLRAIASGNLFIAAKLAVACQVPVAGLKSSAIFRELNPVEFPPPATSTCPFASSVALWLQCGVVMRPVVVHCPVAGLNSSAVAKQLLLTLGPPPAPNTSPFGSGVAVANTRATDMLPVGFHLLLAALKSSALARDSPLLVLAIPPATRNSPVFMAVEVCRARAVFMLPVNENVP